MCQHGTENRRSAGRRAPNRIRLMWLYLGAELTAENGSQSHLSIYPARMDFRASNSLRADLQLALYSRTRRRVHSTHRPFLNSVCTVQRGIALSLPALQGGQQTHGHGGDGFINRRQKNRPASAGWRCWEAGPAPPGHGEGSTSTHTKRPERKPDGSGDRGAVRAAVSPGRASITGTRRRSAGDEIGAWPLDRLY